MDRVPRGYGARPRRGEPRFLTGEDVTAIYPKAEISARGAAGSIRRGSISTTTSRGLFR